MYFLVGYFITILNKSIYSWTSKESKRALNLGEGKVWSRSLILFYLLISFSSIFLGSIGNVPVMLAKPQTFMNASGESVSFLNN